MELAIRIPLFGGDCAPRDFGLGDDVLTTDGIAVGNFSDVATISTDGLENEGTRSATMSFADDELGPRFFVITDSAVLRAVFFALACSGELVFGLVDEDSAEQSST